MKEDKKLENIEKLLANTIERFYKKRNKNRYKTFLFKIISIIGSSIVTILLGFGSIGEIAPLNIIIKDIAFILSVIITALASIDAFYDHRSLWIRYTQTLNSLYQLSDKIQFNKAGNSSLKEADINKFFNEYENILFESNKYWTELRKERKSEDEKSKNNI